MTSKQRKTLKAAETWGQGRTERAPEPAATSPRTARPATTPSLHPCGRCTMHYATEPGAVCQWCQDAEPAVEAWAECNRCTLESRPA